MNVGTIVLLGLIVTGAIIGFYRREQLAPPALRLLPYFLLFQFAYQLAASLYSFVFTAHASNHFIFNLSIPINLIYFSYLFHSVIMAKRKRNVIVIGLILNLIFFFVNLAFIQGFSFLMTYSRTLMAASLVVFSLLYFTEAIGAEEKPYEINPLHSAPFWIITAIFFFYLSSTLTIIFWNYFVVNETNFGSIMMRIFAFVLYAMYVVGLLLHRPAKVRS
jgi:hypothetical protein